MPSVWPLLRKSVSVYVRYPLPFAALASVGVASGFLVVRDVWLFELWTIALVLIGSIVGAAMTVGAASAEAGAGPRLARSVRKTFLRLRDVLEFTLRHYGASSLLAITIVGIPWAVRILVRWTFGLQAVVLNDLTAKQAISESCRLVGGRWWRIALLMIFSVSWWAPVVAFEIGWPDSAAILILRIALGLTAGPVVAIFWTLLFLQLQEGSAAAPGAALPEASAP